MTQDANPLDALRATLADKLGTDVVAARADLVADGLNPDAKIEFDETGDAPIKPEDLFHAALHHLEAEGAALLQTAEAEGRKILGIAEHNVRPADRAVAPHRHEMALALPLARADEVLHESEHAVIRAFMDVGDVLRRVYLNVHGLWVKA